jgi:hypothetical protein
MRSQVRLVRYYHTTVKDRPGEGCRILKELADNGVNLLAFSAVPIGPGTSQLMLFPEEDDLLLRAAEATGISLENPQHAFLIQGEDHLGALAAVHHAFADAHVNIFASNGVAGGCGGYGCVIYVRPEDVEAAAAALGV